MTDSIVARYTLPKKERLKSRTLIGKLFTGTNKSYSAYPVRIVFMPVTDDSLPTASVMFSVSTKRFKRAVKRNLVKRQMREAYRKNKNILVDALEAKGKKAVAAFLWLDKEIHETSEVEEKIRRLLMLTSEKL